jgi:hypothetical protein
MPKHTFKLLALMMAFSVTPATAGHRIATAAAMHHPSGCPHELARLEAAAAQKAATTITLTDRVPADSSLLGIGRGSGVFAP